MKIKKINAAAALFLIALLLIHVIYEVWSYVAFFYNPLVTAIIAYSFAAVACFHMVLAGWSVFRVHDGSTLRMYPRANLGTILQRCSAVVIIVLLPIHAKTGDWVAGHAVGQAGFTFLMCLQVLFWLLIGIHVTVSLSRALITLGVLSDMRRKKTIDIVTAVVCAVGLTFAAYVVIRTDIFLFSM